MIRPSGRCQLDLMQPDAGRLACEDRESMRQITAAIRFTRTRAALLGEAPLPVRVIARVVERFVQLLSRTCSPLEREFLALLTEAGVEFRFEAQAPVSVGVPQSDGTLRTVVTVPDFSDVRERLAVYVDGATHHATVEAIERDDDLSFALALDGWRVLRVSSAAIRQRPAKVIRQLREAYAP